MTYLAIKYYPSTDDELETIFDNLRTTVEDKFTSVGEFEVAGPLTIEEVVRETFIWGTRYSTLEEEWNIKLPFIILPIPELLSEEKIAALFETEEKRLDALSD
jgi:hypothetical protein